MTYEELVDFIDNNMKMSHIYQPVMLMELLANNGTLKDSEVAKAILVRDPSQIEYYTNITNNMVGRVLRNNSVVDRDRGTKCFSLIGFENLDADQIEILKNKCLERLETYLASRDPFGHRRRAPGYITGSIRYKILKRAKFHCELCGISAEEKALEVDHILPRNCGGSDELSNLQSLCYSCNSMKRDTDDTDFRAIRESYSHRAADCLFCNPENQRILAENELAYVFADGFPVTEGHVLIIPKRHVANYFELGQAEVNACTSLLNEQQELARQNDASIEGLNIGVNVGEVCWADNHALSHTSDSQKEG